MPPGLFGSTTIDCSACMEKQPPAGRPVDARHAIKATSIPVSTFTRPIASRANNCRFRFTPVELGKYQNRSQTSEESPLASPARSAIDRGWVRLRVGSSTLPSIDTLRQVATNPAKLSRRDFTRSSVSIKILTNQRRIPLGFARAVRDRSRLGTPSGRLFDALDTLRQVATNHSQAKPARLHEGTF
jgi:hypothetical protein